MKTDSVLKIDGMKALIAALGLADAGRFISLINREPFDYTEWQREHFAKYDDMETDEFGEMAAAVAAAVQAQRTQATV